MKCFLFILVLSAVLLCGCATSMDGDVKRIIKHCPYQFNKNGYFISDEKFGFVKPLFPKNIKE